MQHLIAVKIQETHKKYTLKKSHQIAKEQIM